MKKKLFKALGGAVVASPLIVILVIDIRQAALTPLVFSILAGVFSVATTFVGLWLMGFFEC